MPGSGLGAAAASLGHMPYSTQYQSPICSTGSSTELKRATMPATRLMPTEEAQDLVDLAREIATKELAPRAPEAEREAVFARDIFRMLGQAGLMSLPYPEE